MMAHHLDREELKKAADASWGFDKPQPAPAVRPLTADHLRKTLEKFVSVAMTCKKTNTPEWMAYFAERINAVLETLDSDSRVSYPGKWSNEFHFEIGGKPDAKE